MMLHKTKPIHVMHVLGNLGMGGAEMGVLRLIQALSSDDFRHSIAILGSDRSLLDVTGADIPCYAMGITGASHMAFWPLQRLFRQQQVDIVHVNNLAPWLDCAIAARMAGCRCIETFHGVEEGTLSFSRLRKGMFCIAALCSNKVTAVATQAGELFSELTGMSERQVDIILNGVDCDFFAPVKSSDEKAELRRLKGLPEKALLFGCVAALRPVKNHQGLLRAFAAALGQGLPDAELVLVGDGPLREEFQSLAEELGIDSRVHFLGKRTDVKDFLRCFDVFVLNSDTEGLSYALLEAMACGLPAVATSVGANPVLITSGENGYLVPPGDELALAGALLRMGEQRDRLLEMGEGSRERVVTGFSLYGMASAYQKLYEQILPGKRGGPCQC